MDGWMEGRQQSGKGCNCMYVLSAQGLGLQSGAYPLRTGKRPSFRFQYLTRLRFRGGGAAPCLVFGRAWSPLVRCVRHRRRLDACRCACPCTSSLSSSSRPWPVLDVTT